MGDSLETLTNTYMIAVMININISTLWSGNFPKILISFVKKGFYPYEWFDNTEKFNHIGLPEQKEFYSTTSQTHISDDDYKHVCSVYDALGCKLCLDYHLAYLKCDVLCLADVFEKFRDTCQTYYELDPANYISAPGLAWDAMLLSRRIELEQISDLKILDIIERQKRGGFMRCRIEAACSSK